MDETFQNTLEAARNLGVRFFDDSPPTAVTIKDPELHDLHFVDWGDDSGNKPTVIFIHGFLQQARTWDFTCLALRSRFRCISLDLRGHGDSGPSEDLNYTTHGYLEDAKRLVNHMSTGMGISEFSICGLSLGGQLAYILASEMSEVVESIIVVDVAPQLNREARRGIQRYIDSLPSDGSFGALVDRVTELSPRRNRESVEGSLLRAVDLESDGSWRWKHDQQLLKHHRVSFSSDQLWAFLGGVSAPTLFVMGGNSKLVAPEVVRRMVETVVGSSACYVPDASHRVPGDNPLGFIRAIEPFLEHNLIRERKAVPKR